jgi:hypothetical protein
MDNLFHFDYLAPYADSLLGVAGAGADDAAPAGLDVLDDEPQLDTGGSASLSMLYTLLAKSGNENTVERPGGNGSAAVEIPRKAFVASLHGTLLTAIENKQRDSRKIDDMPAPMVHLRDAARSLDKASSTYARVGDRAGFDTVAFRAVYAEYTRAAAQLAELLGGGSRD